MRALALAAALALWGSGAAAQDACLLFCPDAATLQGEAAAARLEAVLGGPLPPGTIVDALREEGFLDGYLQARLDMDAAGLRALLRTAGLSGAKLAPHLPWAGATASPAWWDWVTRKDVKSGYGELGPGRYVTIYVAPGDPGRRTVWIEVFDA